MKHRLAALVATCTMVVGTLALAQPSSVDSQPRYLAVANSVDPETLVPGMATGLFESNIIRNLFDGLVGYDPKTAAPIPEAATSWSVSPDGKTYTFHLRAGMRWSDGKAISAHDYHYSWMRVLNPETHSKYAFILYYIKNAKAYHAGEIHDPSVVGIKVVDAQTLQVTLERPSPFFVELLGHHAYRAVPRHAIEKYGDAWIRPEHAVTSGPFTLKSWIPHQEVLIVRNPYYWDAESVKLDGVRFLPTEDKHTALKRYKAGEIDVLWTIPDQSVPGLVNRSDFYSAPHFSTYFYRLNVTKAPLNDKRVRQALTMAINRPVLVEQFLHNQEVVSSTFTPKGLTDYQYPSGLPFDPKKARAMMAEAGFSDPSKFPKLTILYNTDEQNRLVAQVVQQMWRENLGIEVTLQNEEWKSYLQSRRMLQYDVARSGWVGDYADPNTFLDTMMTASSENQTGWENAEYDAILNKAASEKDAAKRLDLLRQAETILLDDAPLIPLYTYTKEFMKRPQVLGFYPNILDIHPYRWVQVVPSTRPWDIIRSSY